MPPRIVPPSSTTSSAGIHSVSNQTSIPVPSSSPVQRFIPPQANTALIQAQPPLAGGMWAHNNSPETLQALIQILGPLSLETPAVAKEVLSGLIGSGLIQQRQVVESPQLSRILSQGKALPTNGPRTAGSNPAFVGDLARNLSQVTGIPVEQVLVIASSLIQQTPQAAARKFNQPAELAVLKILSLLHSLPIASAGAERAALLLLIQTPLTSQGLIEALEIFEHSFLSLPKDRREEVVEETLKTPNGWKPEALQRIAKPVADQQPAHSNRGSSSTSSQASSNPSGVPNQPFHPADTKFVAHQGNRPWQLSSEATDERHGLRSRGNQSSPLRGLAITATPAQTAQDMKDRRALGMSLYDALSSLPFKQAASLKPLLLRLAGGQVTPQLIEGVMGQLKPLLESSKGPTLEKILRAWNHPSWQVKLLVVRALKEMAPKDKAIPLELVALARNRASGKVRSEAIRVALDMSQSQQQSREDMEAILKKLEVVSTLKELFNSKRTDLMKTGLEILSRYWAWLHPDVRAGFEASALTIARESRSDELSLMALNLLLTHVRDLTDESRRALMSKDLYSRILLSIELSHRSGGSYFTTPTRGGKMMSEAMKAFSNGGVEPLPRQKAA